MTLKGWDLSLSLCSPPSLHRFGSIEQFKKFPPNVIVNQKYSLITFFPLVLYEQSFLISTSFWSLYRSLYQHSRLVIKPPIFVSTWRMLILHIPSIYQSQFLILLGYIFTYFGPLCFVLIITISKEALDDWHRFKRDKEANSQLYQILTPDGVKNVPSSKLKVGDMAIVRKDQRVSSRDIGLRTEIVSLTRFVEPMLGFGREGADFVPADLILLRTTETSGACFIRTDQLDGETDWKLRYHELLLSFVCHYSGPGLELNPSIVIENRLAVPSCQKLPSDNALLQIHGEVYADAPHKDIHSFVGNFTRDDLNQTGPHVESLGVENTLWTNTVLASGTAIGFVIYTGKDTRAVMNTNHPQTKVGSIDREINRLSKVRGTDCDWICCTGGCDRCREQLN
ncbi:hypothetical protein BC936DRAFT_139704 [Jimgerdemannia flammicorona]|uniref:P-type ATPase N-terminal domain-containing protein n=1 Tax=Jimgerdemannia flammicorona TaxID=994334 RepID=A0A433DHK9_9FUNG|nr:hypothetical protein BC936DRAFT_139704 [Jimgerdemannia flammicorona]